jgi:succinate dehydrogenase/fumarate reductase flavoprotein subunit
MQVQPLLTGTLRWPYPVNYGKENEIIADILVLGGGLAGCWAAIGAAKQGLKVVFVEKGATIHSGSAGNGIDHWQDAATNPASKVTPEELAKATIDARKGYINGISRYIKCQESYDRLLELEKMGMKIRDSEDEFKGAPFRDEKTKLLFSFNYRDKHSLRIWGTGMKPALYKECKRLGIDVHDRIMATSLLTEGGEQGARVVGATGVHTRTGEFFIFKAKATVLSMAGIARLWQFVDTLGTSAHRPPLTSGDGFAMAWRAGADFALMEFSEPGSKGGVGSAGGSSNATWFPCTLVDANGKEIPWIDKNGETLSSVAERNQPASGQKYFLGGGKVVQGRSLEVSGPQPIPDSELRERIKRGEFVLPLYADLPSMPEYERRAIFGLMVGQEGLTWLAYRVLTKAGFDPHKDMLQVSSHVNTPDVRSMPLNGGGLVVDWDLGTSLEGLYAAGEQAFGTWGAAGASTSGHYAGKSASQYALKADEPVIARKQVNDEKERIYAPISRNEGTDWKNLENGIARVMQDCCGDIKNEQSLKIGLNWLEEFKRGHAQTLYASDPHQLMRALECLNILTAAQIHMHACLARKASSRWLSFYRSDYPQLDPPEWNKLITVKLENGEVKVGELPIDYGSPLKENYEAHCVR